MGWQYLAPIRRETRAPCYPPPLQSPCGTGMPCGIAACCTARGIDRASCFPRQPVWRFFIGAVFSQKGLSVGIAFKSLTYIYESRERVCHSSCTVLRLLHRVSSGSGVPWCAGTLGEGRDGAGEGRDGVGALTLSPCLLSASVWLLVI